MAVPTLVAVSPPLLAKGTVLEEILATLEHMLARDTVTARRGASATAEEELALPVNIRQPPEAAHAQGAKVEHAYQRFRV
jgi:hypothetical protein